MRVLDERFHVSGYERRWELLELRERAFSLRGYPEGHDINDQEGHDGRT